MNSVKNITLKIWRQAGPNAAGRFENHVIDEISDEVILEDDEDDTPKKKRR